MAMVMPEVRARANFEYFVSQRAVRTEALRQFLSQFGVSLDFSEVAKSSLDAWLASHGAFLYVHENRSSYHSRLPAWEGARLGLNVIHDLAVYLGDFAIQESPGLYWEMNTDVPTGLQTQDHTFQNPVVAGFPNSPRWRFDPLTDVHRICDALRHRTYMWQRPMFRMSPQSLYTHFVSKTLSRTYLWARGDKAGANRVMTDQ
jgi:hypothetical protein